MPDGTGDIKRGRKFDQVIEGARTVFMANGFEGASVDDIAREAGVSKATLYNYFPDKRLLFMEVAKLECRKIASQAIETMDFTQPVADVLLDGARHMIDFITSDFGQRVFRICVAESERFPNVGREFFECGPAVVREQLQAGNLEFLASEDFEPSGVVAPVPEGQRPDPAQLPLARHPQWGTSPPRRRLLPRASQD